MSGSTRCSVFDKDGNLPEPVERPGAGRRAAPRGRQHRHPTPQDNVYISDGRSHEVRKFTRDGKFLTSLGQFTGPRRTASSTPPGALPWTMRATFTWPTTCNHRVQKFTSDGEWVAQFGAPGAGPGQACTIPVDVTVDPDKGTFTSATGADNGFSTRAGCTSSTPRATSSSPSVGDAQQLSRWAQMTVDAKRRLHQAPPGSGPAQHGVRVEVSPCPPG